MVFFVRDRRILEHGKFGEIIRNKISIFKIVFWLFLYRRIDKEPIFGCFQGFDLFYNQKTPVFVLKVLNQIKFFESIVHLGVYICPVFIPQ
jgi:hypothetical protein